MLESSKPYCSRNPAPHKKNDMPPDASQPTAVTASPPGPPTGHLTRNNRLIETSSADRELFQLLQADSGVKTDAEPAGNSPFSHDAILACEGSDEAATTETKGNVPAAQRIDLGDPPRVRKNLPHFRRHGRKIYRHP